jgi:hypothetical protein
MEEPGGPMRGFRDRKTFLKIFSIFFLPSASARPFSEDLPRFAQPSANGEEHPKTFATLRGTGLRANMKDARLPTFAFPD